MSNDMPMTDEYFDEVLFVALNGAESQRSLDKMKREMSVKACPSPYSREGSLTSCTNSSSQHFEKAPIASYAGISSQNQVVGDPYQSSYTSQPLSETRYGRYYSTPSTHNARQGFDFTGISRGYGYPMIRESNSGYGMDGPYNHTGVQGRHFLHGDTVDPSQSNITEPYPRAPSSGSTGMPCDQIPAIRHSAYQSVTPPFFPYAGLPIEVFLRVTCL